MLSNEINAYQKQIEVISMTSEMILYQSLVIDISLYFHCSVFWNTSDFSIHLMQFTSQVKTPIIPTQCFYRFFGDFDWSVGKIKLFLHFHKNPCVGIFDNCLDFTVLDCVDNNEPYRKLYNFNQIKYS